MAVPKKKVSYSKTRKRLLSKKGRLSLYRECQKCLNFIRLHKYCFACSGQGSYSKFKTNIDKLYENDF